jgi:CelD/BcsL family acetyltransferase involved in cellulose biosynthesis
LQEREPADSGELQASLAEMIEMHQAQWTGDGWMGHFGDWPGIREFYVDMVEAFRRRKALIMREVRVRGRCVASELCVHFGRRAHWLVGGRRERVPGRVGFCAVLRAALERGITEIDAMMGYYEYKRRLGAEIAHVQTITAISGSLDSRLRWRIAQAVTWWRFLWYYRIWYWRLVPRIRRCFTRHPELLRKTLSHKFLRSRFLVGAGAAREGRSEQA